MRKKWKGHKIALKRATDQVQLPSSICLEMTVKRRSMGQNLAIIKIFPLWACPNLWNIQVKIFLRKIIDSNKNYIQRTIWNRF